MNKFTNGLKAHLPEGKNSWDRTHFEVSLAGGQFQIRVLRRGRQPVEEADAVEPLLRDLRDTMWHEQSSLGLWYSMAFVLSADGRIFPRFDYETRPTFNERPVDLAEAKADLVRAPRPAKWVPAWLATS